MVYFRIKRVIILLIISIALYNSFLTGCIMDESKNNKSLISVDVKIKNQRDKIYFINDVRICYDGDNYKIIGGNGERLTSQESITFSGNIYVDKEIGYISAYLLCTDNVDEWTYCQLGEYDTALSSNLTIEINL